MPKGANCRFLILGILYCALPVAAAPAQTGKNVIRSARCDYVVTNDDQLTAVLANPASELSKKAICLLGSFGPRVLTKSGLLSTLTITSGDWEKPAKVDSWTIATGTNHLTLDHLHFQMLAWPKSQPGVLMLGNSPGTLDDLTIAHGVFRHGYGMDHSAFDVSDGCNKYPEYCRPPPDNITNYLAYAIARDGALTKLSNLILDGNVVTDVWSGFKFQVDGGSIVVRGNSLDRIYEDCLTFASDKTTPSILLIAWNSCTHQFQGDSDISGGHPDFIQLFGTENTPDWTGITIEGNRQLIGNTRGTSQGIFLQGIGARNKPSKWGARIVGNLILTRGAPLEIFVDYTVNTIVAYNTAARSDPTDRQINVNAGQINVGGYDQNSGLLCVSANIGEAVSFGGAKTALPAMRGQSTNTNLGLNGKQFGYRNAFSGPFSPDSLSAAMASFAPRALDREHGAIDTVVNWRDMTIDTERVHQTCGF